jgi:hypothetical protein
MLTPFLTRAERFQNFQELAAQIKKGEEPMHVLTRLFNGFTAEFSKAEAEIQRIHQSNNALAQELADLRAVQLQVSFEIHPKGECQMLKSLSALPLPIPPAQCCRCALESKLAESQKQ